MHKITVKAHSRLHLGFISFTENPNGYNYGGIGLSINNPKYVIETTPSDEQVVHGCQKHRAEAILKELAELEEFPVTPVRISIKECIPAHSGFGSTTQLVLALTYSMLLFKAYSKNPSSILNPVTRTELKKRAIEIALKLGRGLISGVGLASFEKGGFIIDYGIRGRRRIYSSVRFPSKWSIVVVVPYTSKERVKDSKEELNLLLKLFSQRSSEGKLLECSAMSIVLRQLLPSLLARDFELFSRSIEEIDNLNAMFFKKQQGSDFCCLESERAAYVLRNEGLRGVGQSSWGPAIYGFYQGRNRITLSRIRQKLAEYGVRLVFLERVKPVNRGVDVLLS